MKDQKGKREADYNSDDLYQLRELQKKRIKDLKHEINSIRAFLERSNSITGSYSLDETVKSETERLKRLQRELSDLQEVVYRTVNRGVQQQAQTRLNNREFLKLKKLSRELYDVKGKFEKKFKEENCEKKISWDLNSYEKLKDAYNQVTRQRNFFNEKEVSVFEEILEKYDLRTQQETIIYIHILWTLQHVIDLQKTMKLLELQISVLKKKGDPVTRLIKHKQYLSKLLKSSLQTLNSQLDYYYPRSIENINSQLNNTDEQSNTSPDNQEDLSKDFVSKKYSVREKINELIKIIPTLHDGVYSNDFIEKFQSVYNNSFEQLQAMDEPRTNQILRLMNEFISNNEDEQNNTEYYERFQSVCNDELFSKLNDEIMKQIINQNPEFKENVSLFEENSNNRNIIGQMEIGTFVLNDGYTKYYKQAVNDYLADMGNSSEEESIQNSDIELDASSIVSDSSSMTVDIEERAVASNGSQSENGVSNNNIASTSEFNRQYSSDSDSDNERQRPIHKRSQSFDGFPQPGKKRKK